MTIWDLVFLGSVLLELSLLVLLAVRAVRRQWNGLRRAARFAGLYAAAYATALVFVSLMTPRRYLPAGQSHCFDDWCVAALSAERSPTATGPIWTVTLEVSSVAKRVRQRARDASAQMEDTHGHRYNACVTPRPALSNEIGPGESFRTLLSFCLPAQAIPAGVVIHHGAFPGAVIIGDDQSFLHPPTLARVAIPAALPSQVCAVTGLPPE